MNAKPNRPPTSAQVAKVAGVSRTTVSFVLNGVRDQGISETTRARVLAVAQELGYQPNAAARSLASGNTGTVALLIPKAAHLYVDAFLAQLVAAINDECHQHGLKMLIESNDDDSREPGSFVNLVLGRRIDGLIVANPRLVEFDHLMKVKQSGIAMVVLSAGRRELEPFHTVGTSTMDSARRLTQHLIGLGHRQIGFVSYAPPEYDSVSERELGWRTALQEIGVAPDPNWVDYADISAQSGYEATRRLLARSRGLTALFAGNDTIAFGALRALREAGLRVPQDVALVGFDDIPLAAFADPPLTTMRTDPVGSGKAAMQSLLTQLQGQAAGSASRIEQSARLVIRESCGARLLQARS